MPLNGENPNPRSSGGKCISSNYVSYFDPQTFIIEGWMIVVVWHFALCCFVNHACQLGFMRVCLVLVGVD